jgi:hypothetical protein
MPRQPALRSASARLSAGRNRAEFGALTLNHFGAGAVMISGLMSTGNFTELASVCWRVPAGGTGRSIVLGAAV